MEPLLILLAFFAGLAFKSLGYPAMPGYLVAGFMAHWLGLGEASLISAIADLGLLLLLFTIGLKLNLKDILMPQVWAVAGLQMLIVVPLTFLSLSVPEFCFLFWRCRTRRRPGPWHLRCRFPARCLR